MLEISLIKFLKRFVREDLEFLIALSFQQIVARIQTQRDPASVGKAVGQFAVDIMEGITHILFVIRIETVLEEEGRGSKSGLPSFFSWQC